MNGTNDIEGDWLLDLGNTRLKLARVDAGRAVAINTWPMDSDSLPSELNARLATSAPRTRAWLASSADVQRRDALCAGMAAIGMDVRIAAVQTRCRRLQVAYADPSRLGVDRFLALLAASERDDGPWLVVSVGSAMTVDLLDVDGRHVGGMIALSPDLHRQALASRIAHLDVPGGVALDFAADTADAMASGALMAALGLLERSLRRAQLQLGRSPTLLLTGGGAEALLPQLDTDARFLPALALDGLALYARTFASLPA